MRARGTKKERISVCGLWKNSRILNCDRSGRSLRALQIQQPFGVRNLSVLSDLRVGGSGVLVALDLPESVQNHLMHMGFVPDARVTALRRAPAGDPTVYGVDGMEIALRRETASAIRMKAAEEEEEMDCQPAAEAEEIRRLTVEEGVPGLFEATL